MPIVEPEVLMDGAHTIERCEEVTDAVLAEVFAQLEHGADPPRRHDPQAQHGDLGQEVLRRAPAPSRWLQPLCAASSATFPAPCRASPSSRAARAPSEATLHLSLMNRGATLPWQLSFSYGRALQDAALQAWGGKPGNVAAGQKEFQKWARLNGLARNGCFQAGMEQQAA